MRLALEGHSLLARSWLRRALRVPFIEKYRASRNGDKPSGAAPILLLRRPENGYGSRHLVSLPFAGSGWRRRNARARTLPLAFGVCHSQLPLSALPVTSSGGDVPPASGFGRCRHSRVSGNAHKPLTS